jgi:hypothetical protein
MGRENGEPLPSPLTEVRDRVEPLFPIPQDGREQAADPAEPRAAHHIRGEKLLPLPLHGDAHDGPDSLPPGSEKKADEAVETVDVSDSDRGKASLTGKTADFLR